MLANGRRLKCLTIVDDFIREDIQMATDQRIGSAYVVRLLDEAAPARGYPAAVRTLATDRIISLPQARPIIAL